MSNTAEPKKDALLPHMVAMVAGLVLSVPVFVGLLLPFVVSI